MENIFAKEVEEGLSGSPKHLSSLYFYDDNGSRIFQEIMAMPAYYLTDCEFEILKTQTKEIHEALGFNGHFNIIELGAGDGLKTKELLINLLTIGADFTYVPIDISEEAIHLLTKKMKQAIPDLNIDAQVGDYFDVMDTIGGQDNSPNLILLLGANIGNFKAEWAIDLLKQINDHMRSNDRLLIGFDLKKNPILIRNAYNDPHGITKRFNLNLLARINRELIADFQLDQFDFYSHYNPLDGKVRSYLVSLREQNVTISKIGKTFRFRKDELISTEISKKYSLEEIEKLAKTAGFEFSDHFLDCKHYFTDSLFTKPE